MLIRRKRAPSQARAIFAFHKHARQFINFQPKVTNNAILEIREIQLSINDKLGAVSRCDHVLIVKGVYFFINFSIIFRFDMERFVYSLACSNKFDVKRCPNLCPFQKY